MLRSAVLVLVVLAGCSGPTAPVQVAAGPDAVSGPAPRAERPARIDPLAAVAPVVRLAAGRADTLVAQDLLGTDAPVVIPPAPDSPVRGEVLRGGRLRLAATPSAQGLYTLPIVVDGAPAALAVEVADAPEVAFRFEPDLTPAGAPPPEVFVIGGFNDWSRTATPLRPQPDGSLGARLRIAPGRYEYKLTVDGAEVLDPLARDSVPNPFGAYNNVLVVRPSAEGALRLRVLGTADGDPDRLQLQLASVAADGTEAAPEEIDDEAGIVALDGNRLLDPAAVFLDPASGRLDVDLDELAPGLRRLRLAARGTEPGDARVSNWVEVPVWNHRPAAATPDAPWTWNDAVIYQIVVDRFRDGDPANNAPVVAEGLSPKGNYQGGDLAGVLAALRDGTFRDLGVSALWLSPLYDNPDHAEREFPAPHRLYTGYHGYWPVAPRAVEPRFGDLALLREVVAEAHAQGLRVLLDFVANHVHEDHPYAREHPEWFGTLELPDGSLNLRRWDDYRLTTWFEPYLPSFDFEGAPAAVEQLTADAVWWLAETGADGFRHDAVKHVPNTFWRALTARLQPLGGTRDLFQIGETFGSYDLVSSYVTPGQLDAQFNFNLYDAATAALARGGALRGLADEVDASLGVYGPLHTMGNPISSHDKPRFLALVENDVVPGEDDKEPGWSAAPPRVDDPASYRRQALALAYTLTTPGVPVVYYGDEVGMTGANDPDNRRFMVRDGLSAAQRALREDVAALIRLRRDTPALRTGTFETLAADDTAWLYRRTAPGSDVLVALNTGDAERVLDLGALGEAGGTDLLAPERAVGAALRVPAGGYRVVALR